MYPALGFEASSDGAYCGCEGPGWMTMYYNELYRGSERVGGLIAPREVALKDPNSVSENHPDSKLVAAC